jgi:uncharacterized DUF497 family protein
MDFEWDEAKAHQNFAKHGVSFEYATRAVLDPRGIAVDATRPEDGEERTKLIAQIDGVLYTVVLTVRGSVIRLISARRSNGPEEKLYGSVQA